MIPVCLPVGDSVTHCLMGDWSHLLIRLKLLEIPELNKIEIILIREESNL